VDIAIGEAGGCPAGYDKTLFAAKFPQIREMAVTSKVDETF